MRRINSKVFANQIKMTIIKGYNGEFYDGN